MNEKWLTYGLKGMIGGGIALIVLGCVVWIRAGSVMSVIDLSLTRLPQSTVLSDAMGGELYRFFDQDRKRVGYDDISPHMIHAIVAAEDQTFWTNMGVDLSAIVRALHHNITTDSAGLQGGSTITQQVIKNLLLSRQKTYRRKLKESVMAVYRTMQRRVQHRSGGASRRDAMTTTKQDILTAYLNIVYYGNHTYGIESAAQQYFDTSARQLGVIQSAVLASLPQSPSRYNPARYPEFVMGYREREESQIVYGSVEPVLVDIDPLYLDSSNCLGTILQVAQGLMPGYRYVTGRKDRVLCRMVEGGQYSLDEIIRSFVSATALPVSVASFEIKAPHFVFYIQQTIHEHPYFQQQLLDYQQIIQGGYRIQTTLDPRHQQAAQDAVDNYRTMLRRRGGNNRAVLHTDSRTGAIKAYLGSQDFADTSIAGQVDVIQAHRQIGSTLKPFIYAKLLSDYQYTPDSNIADYKIASLPVNNHDGQFRGTLTLTRALAASRNIPVVRMYYALGGSEVLVPYLQGLGFVDLQDDRDYTYPLVLGADEATLMQLAQAYSQLSVEGDTYAPVTAIQSITAPDGEVVYTLSPANETKDIPDTIGQMLRGMLSDPTALPIKRKRLRNIGITTFAMKTGTSDRKVGGVPYPRDALSVVYTSEDVVVMRAGNTDGRVMGSNAYGGETNFYPMRQYITALAEQGLIVDRERVLTDPEYTEEGYYAGAEISEFTEEQKTWLWRL